MFDPEAIELALFALIQEATTGIAFKTVARHGRPWSNTGIEGQPALYLIPNGFVTSEDQTFNLPKYIFQYDVLVYTRTDDNDAAIPQTMLNAAAKAIVLAIAGIPPGFKQTLGGLVENCWVEGTAEMGTGLLDEQCSLQIPIHAITGL